MKFTIITPTYNRPDELAHAVESVLNQTHKDFQVIIVNDSPDCDYTNFENKYSSNAKIIYIKNKENFGVNFSRNIALEKTKDLDSDYVIFLDDDDWLYPDALEKINKILEKDKHEWLITNRTLSDKNLVKVKQENITKYNYFLDALIFKKITGDMTHAIKSSIATQFCFSTKVKQGEEWFYFIQIPYTLNYKNINTTDSEGYAIDGLTDQLKTKYKENTKSLWKEKLTFRMFLYLILRSIYSLTK